MMHGGFMAKMFRYAILIVLLMYVVKQPEQAGNTAADLLGFLEDAGTALGAFTASL